MEGGSSSIYSALGMQKSQPTEREESKASLGSRPHYSGDQRLLTLSSKGAQFYKLQASPSGFPAETQLFLDPSFPSYASAITGKFAPHKGHFAVVVDLEGIHFVDTASGKETRFINHFGVTAIALSPRDTYLITCEKYNQGRGNNLIVWSTLTGSESAIFEWKKQSKEGPKSIKFSQDERFCARLSSKTTIDFYEGGDFSQPKATITANAQTLGKKSESETKKQFWFDGVDFIPVG
jgi:WD40 repeat protein